MIAKRFTHKEDDWEILDNGEHLAYAHSGYNAQKIIERLNELYDKLDCHILLTDQERQKVRNFIKGLEKENEQLKDTLNQRTDQCDKYYKENEQLKQINQELYDYFENYLDEIREEIDYELYYELYSNVQKLKKK